MKTNKNTIILALSHKLTIDLPNPIYTSLFAPLYDNFNREHFDKEVYIPEGFESFIETVYNAHKQQFSRLYIKGDMEKLLSMPTYKDGKTVLLGFSAGLDSVYQAIYLKEKGYKVILFYLRNANMYENGQSYKHAITIADKLNLRLITANISPNTKKDNPYRKYWAENPIKNQYIMSMMVDYCIKLGIKYISMGDDFNLDIKHAAVGINLTDAHELTETWLSGVHKYIPDLEFIPIDKGHDKDERIKKLIEYNLQDDFYSCVQSGRFNQRFHTLSEEKYGIKLFQNNCGTYCRKCAMHNLILHYKGILTFPEDFINKCWERMWNNAHSADYVFFSPDIPLEQRIKNLLEY